MDQAQAPEKIARIGTVAAMVALISGLGWGATAVGATINQTDCKAFANATGRHQSPVEALSINPVDHVSIEANKSNIDALKDASTTVDSATPFLYLTPRVVSVLRNIFDVTHDNSSLNDKKDIVSSPIAETDKSVDTVEPFDDGILAPAIDGEVIPLQLQRQMYRTDI